MVNWGEEPKYIWKFNWGLSVIYLAISLFFIYLMHIISPIEHNEPPYLIIPEFILVIALYIFLYLMGTFEKLVDNPNIKSSKVK